MGHPDMATNFDPSATRDLYDRFKAGWKANVAFAEMVAQTLRNGDYLQEFGGKTEENKTQFSLRKRWSMALDICDDLVDLRVRNLFRVPPIRSFEDSPWVKDIDEFIRDVDLGGTGIDAFMECAVREMYINGADIVIDKESSNGKPIISKADEAGLRYYLQRFGPLERLDWRSDHVGAYHWVRYDLGESVRLGESDDDPEQHTYLTMTRDGWVLHKTSASDSVGVDSVHGTHTLGVCPVVPLYFRRSVLPENDAIPLSLMTRLSPIAEFMLNLVSQGQLDLYLSVAFFVLFGVAPKDVPKSMGAAQAWAFTDSEGSMSNVTVSVEHIKEKREWLDLCIEAMLRIGKVTGISGEIRGRAGSGVQVAIERTELDNELAATAGQCESVERRIIQLMLSRKHPESATAGRTPGLIDQDVIKYGVHYNRRYVLSGSKELIDQAKALSDIPFTDEIPSLMRQALRKVTDALGSEGDPDYEAALAEIAKATMDGTVAATPEGE